MANMYQDTKELKLTYIRSIMNAYRLYNPYASLPRLREGYVDQTSPIYYGGKTSKGKKKKKK